MSEENKEEIKKEANTMQLAGRTIVLGLSVKYCIEKGIRPSDLRKDFENPIFNNWEYLLNICNIGTIEGEPFTIEAMALEVMGVFNMVLMGSSLQAKPFLAKSSEDSNEKPPSS